MSPASISHTFYILDQRKSNWSAEHEKGISTIYPFELQPSGADDHVARTYLQFLWLPNSLMPLAYLVPSLRRVEAPSALSSNASHPLHALLEPLLLTTRSVTNKYHSELLQILANGAGAGEMEEAMMWYAVEHEKLEVFDGLPAGPSSQKHGQDGEEGQWTDEKWRERYLERMERREVQIQILLYMFKFSLPEHPSTPSTGYGDSSKASRPGKRQRISKHVATEPILTVKDHLEAFMDKLAMWQLVGRFANAPAMFKKQDRTGTDERDWTQIFVEDVVEPHFKEQLPELCKLLRTKVFPTPPFSDTESDAAPIRIASPGPTDVPTSIPTGFPLQKALSRSILSPTHSTSTSFTSRNLVRSRSSSLSLSLAQEQQERAAAAAVAAEQQTRNRGRLAREVSMTRVFKNKGKGRNLGIAGDKKSASMKIEPPKVQKTRKDKGVTLVDETPVKPRILTSLEKTKNEFIEPLSLVIAKSDRVFRDEDSDSE